MKLPANHPMRIASKVESKNLPAIGSQDWGWKYSISGYWASPLHDYRVKHGDVSSADGYLGSFPNDEAAMLYVEAMLHFPDRITELKPTYVVVFDDGETWSELSGCTIYAVRPQSLEQLHEGVALKHLKDLVPVTLEEIVEEEHRNR